jgi:hypothetical protein
MPQCAVFRLHTAASPSTSCLCREDSLTHGMVWPYSSSMATQTIKTTYALDVDTVRALEKMARRWGVSKSEALRRAIRSAAATAGAEEGGPLEALDRLQRSADLSAAKADAWVRRTRTARRESSSRRESTSG